MSSEAEFSVSSSQFSSILRLYLFDLMSSVGSAKLCGGVQAGSNEQMLAVILEGMTESGCNNYRILVDAVRILTPQLR